MKLKNTLSLTFFTLATFLFGPIAYSMNYECRAMIGQDLMEQDATFVAMTQGFLIEGVDESRVTKTISEKDFELFPGDGDSFKDTDLHQSFKLEVSFEKVRTSQDAMNFVLSSHLTLSFKDLNEPFSVVTSDQGEVGQKRLENNLEIRLPSLINKVGPVYYFVKCTKK